MRSHHPNWRRVIIATAVLALVSSGCRSQQQAPLANPFLAPDRVPPPSTRAIAPGAAQPYYPGDPLPVMQSATTPAASALADASTAPAASEESPTVAAVHSTAASEDPIAIPCDSGDARFASAIPAMVEGAAAAYASPIQAAGAPAVQPALYSSPSLAVDHGASSVADPAQLSPWRSPQIAPMISPAPLSLVPQSGFGVAIAEPSMSVRIRPVPSSVHDAEQAAYVTPGSGGVLQTVEITELPAAIPSVPDATGQVPIMASPGVDGFRPRGSMR